MSDRHDKPFLKPGVIIRPSRKTVFSELETPNGGSLKVMSREVYAKASRAAGVEIKKVSRKGAAGAKARTSKPSEGVR